MAAITPTRWQQLIEEAKQRKINAQRFVDYRKYLIEREEEE